jgi:hypothetical protein
VTVENAVQFLLRNMKDTKISARNIICLSTAILQDVTNQGHEGAKANLIGKKNVPEQSKVESRDPRNSERAMNSNAILQPTEQSISISSFSQLGTEVNDHVHSSSFLTTFNSNSYQHTGQVDNIDERDTNDPLCASEYVAGMYQYFRTKEQTTSVRPLYMERQPHINEKMRSILTDWLVEVHLKFKLVPETLYLTINLIDRFLEKYEVPRPKLQLVGVTSLLIASKYEEIYPPEIRDLVYICDRAYTKQEVRRYWQFVHEKKILFKHAKVFLTFNPIFIFYQILAMEETILRTLKYQVTIPSAHAFLVRYLKAAHADRRMVQLACYILDGTLQSYKLLNFYPSQLAAAAVFIARRCIGRNTWSPTLLVHAGYCEEEVIPVARAVLQEKFNSSPDLHAVNKKYSSSRYGNVAETTLVIDF